MAEPDVSEVPRESEPAGAPPEQLTGPPAKPQRKRLPMLILAAGAVLALLQLAPHLPHERELDLRLDDARSVVGVDVTWTAPGAGGAVAEEPVQGASFRFEAGQAPRTITTPVRLPDGSYRLEVTVHRSTGSAVVERGITLGDADRLTVPIR